MNYHFVKYISRYLKACALLSFYFIFPYSSLRYLIPYVFFCHPQAWWLGSLALCTKLKQMVFIPLWGWQMPVAAAVWRVWVSCISGSSSVLTHLILICSVSQVHLSLPTECPQDTGNILSRNWIKPQGNTEIKYILPVCSWCVLQFSPLSSRLNLSHVGF